MARVRIPSKPEFFRFFPVTAEIEVNLRGPSLFLIVIRRSNKISFTKKLGTMLLRNTLTQPTTPCHWILRETIPTLNLLIQFFFFGGGGGGERDIQNHSVSSSFHVYITIRRKLSSNFLRHSTRLTHRN